jgi:hypothetical protein
MRGPDAGDRRLKYLASIAPAFQRIVKRSVELFVCTHNTEMQKQAKKREGLLPRCSSLPDQTHQRMHLPLRTGAKAVDAIT